MGSGVISVDYIDPPQKKVRKTEKADIGLKVVLLVPIPENTMTSNEVGVFNIKCRVNFGSKIKFKVDTGADSVMQD